MRRWFPLIILAAAQFVMVLDSSVMNVSISQIVADLDTTVTGVQAAITAYTLVMAAFMLVGAKLGDIWGRDRAFAVGLAVYGLGSLTTALSPNLYVLLFGWSLVEGLGAVLVIPAIAALARSQLRGEGSRLRVRDHRRRRRGGDRRRPGDRWLGDDVLLLAARVRRGGRDRRRDPARAQADAAGAAARPPAAARLRRRGSVCRGPGPDRLRHPPEQQVGLAAARSTRPRSAAHEITPLGFSLVPFLIVGGVFLLWFFGMWEERRERLGQDTLLERALLRIESLRAGLTTLMSQQLVLMGTFFVLPVYLQVVLGLDAFETGKRLLPMSVTMLIAALAGPKLAARLAPRLVVQVGLAAMVVAALVLVGTIDVELNETGLQALARAVRRRRRPDDVAARQRDHVVGAAREDERGGGLQGTAQNLGASLGTALIGSVLLTGLLTGFNDRIAENPALSEPVRARDHGRDPGGDRDRHDRAGARRCDLGRPHARRGGRRHRRLRRRPARSAQEGDARGGAARAPLPHVHAAPAEQAPGTRARRHSLACHSLALRARAATLGFRTPGAASSGRDYPVPAVAAHLAVEP